MKIYMIAGVLFLLLLQSCGQPTRPADDLEEPPTGLFDSDVHEAFFNNLASLCKQSFKGEQVYRSSHGESWADRNMVMHVTECEDEYIHIPFHVDEDHSRTWMFLPEDGRLVFRHQHLNEDGTHEEVSMYGGYANDQGTAFVQYFPADEYTANIIEDGGENVWIVSMDEEMTYFSYALERNGERRFEIVFDLDDPIVD